MLEVVTTTLMYCGVEWRLFKGEMKGLLITLFEKWAVATHCITATAAMCLFVRVTLQTTLCCSFYFLKEDEEGKVNVV